MNRKTITIAIILFVVGVMFSGCIVNHSEYDIYADIQYQDIPNVNPNLISLDVYVPRIGQYSIKNITANLKIEDITDQIEKKYSSEKYIISSPKPVMIWVHGGGWAKGDKDNQLQYKIPFFIDEGWIFVSVNYRLSPAETPDDPMDFDPNRIMYPIHNQDVAAAIAWVHDHIGEYGGDLDQISIMGHSAGAGIVAAIGTNQTFLQKQGLNLSVLKHVICLDTEGYDVRDQIENGSHSQSMMYMNAFGTAPTVWDDASPINNIEPYEQLPSYFIVTRGMKDRINLSERFCAKINMTGAETELIYAMNYTHAEVNDAIGNPTDTIITPALKKFLSFNNATSFVTLRYVLERVRKLLLNSSHDNMTVNSYIDTNNSKKLGIRYKDEIFSHVDITSNITYGANIDSNGEKINLLLDIYEPSGDNLQKRPTLIFIHGGGFTQGNKTSTQIVKLCTDFAKRGYVTVSINYRLQPPGTIDYKEAIQQAMYDAKAAIRYIRATATLWRVDTEKIAVIGSSAGAVTALHTSYLTGPDYEGDSGYPGFSSNVSACVDLWGGLYQSLNAIETNEPPVLIIHGTEDNTVLYSEAVNISSRCEEVSVLCDHHPLVGAGHAPWNLYPVFLPWIIDFLYIHCAQTKSARTTNNIDLFINKIFFSYN